MIQSFVISPSTESEAVFYGNRHDGCTTGTGTAVQCTIIETEYYVMEAIRRLEAAAARTNADIVQL
jgi:hypothetical protein